MAFRFEWDPAKAATNEAKHGVSFGEASTVFGDPLSVTVVDVRHSHGEERFAIFGTSARGRVLAVLHSERGDASESSAHVKPPALSGSPMKKDAPERPVGESADDADELLPEYDLRGGVRGKHAARYAEGTNVVILDPDVAAAFPDPAEVNAVLRAVAGIIREHKPTDDSDRRTA